MATLPEDVDSGGRGPPVPWWSAASPVGGDVVLSGVALLFVAVAFAFVLYHYFPANRRSGTRGGVGAGTREPPSSAAHVQQRGTFGGRGLDAAAAAAAGGRRGGLDADALRSLPVTPYRAKDGEASLLECAVCLAELADGEAARYLPRCGHGFHAECVDPWLRGHPTCPLCRVDVAAPSSVAALPPALPEPANYPMNLPTNVLFWGSHDAFTAARTAGRQAPSAIDGASAALVIEVREPPAPAPRGGDTEKAQGLARLSSLRRLWNRGRHGAAAASSHSCRRASATAADAGSGAEQASAWDLTLA